MIIEQATRRVRRGETSFFVADHPSSSDGMAAFTGGAEAATLGFFDAVLPNCVRMVDIGAYVGFMSLYAADQVAEVHAIEASPSHQALLGANLALNPRLAARITLHRCGVGAETGVATLFRKAPSDSGTSMFRTVERSGLVHGHAEAEIPVRAAASLLDEIGLDRATLVKMDIEGAEYAILPKLRSLLAARQPFLQISFHPFNLVASDPYRTALLRLRAAIDAAEALADYPYLYLHGPAGWQRIDAEDRLSFLQRHLLVAKPVPRVSTAQFGFVDAIGFSATRLPTLDG